MAPSSLGGTLPGSPSSTIPSPMPSPSITFATWSSSASEISVFKVRLARLSECPERRAPLLDPDGDASAELLVPLPVHPRLDEQPERVRVLVELPHPLIGARARPLRGRLGWVEQRDLLGDLRRQMLIEQREQQVLLAAEVVVHGALREPRLLGDLVERGAVEPPPRVNASRRGQQLRPGPRPALAAVKRSPRHQ